MAGYQPRHDTDPVWFNGTQINTLNITSGQTGVRITAVHGWDERPDIRDVRENRSGQDGEYADNLYLGGRTITVEGEVYGSTWANLQSRKRTLAATFMPQSTEVLFKIPDPATASPTTVYATTGMTGYERANVRVLESITFGDSLDPCCQSFQVVLRASDPRIYSDTETSTDSGTTGTSSRTSVVDQTGTYPTLPTVTVTGPTNADWSVTEPTSGFSVGSSSLALSSGESVVLTQPARTVIWNAANYRSRISRSDIVAGWRLDETSGTTADNIQGAAALDMTYTGGFTLNQTGPVTGNASVTLNGSTGYVTHAYSATLNPAAMTVEGWVKMTGASGTIASSYTGAATYGGWRLDADSATQITMTLATSTGGNATSIGYLSTLGLTLTNWVHIVAVFASGDQRLYANGQLVKQSSYAYTVNASAATYLGRRTDTGSAYLAGSLANFYMYSSALSAADASALYASTAATTSSNGYPYITATSTRWASLGTASSTYTLASGGLNTGSKLNVAYRDARI